MAKKPNLTAPCNDCGAAPGEYCHPNCQQVGCKTGKAWADKTDKEIRKDLVEQFTLHHNYGIERIRSYCDVGKTDAILRILKGES